VAQLLYFCHEERIDDQGGLQRSARVAITDSDSRVDFPLKRSRSIGILVMGGFIHGWLPLLQDGSARV
jgi:hypothetical protein